MGLNRDPMKLTGAVVLFFLALLTLGLGAEAGAQPTFTKSFSPSTMGPGSTSTLTFSIINSATSTVTELAFTDNLPAGVTVAGTPAVTNGCSGTVTAVPGDGTISFVDGIIGAQSSCSISVNVTSSTAGTHSNTSGLLTSSAGSSGPATATLTVNTQRPGFSKSFSPNSVSRGGRSTLTFTIDNSGNSLDTSGNFSFTDILPTGMVVADPANISNTCLDVPHPIFPTSTVTADPGGSSIVFSGIYTLLAAGDTCTVSVDVFGNYAGLLDNVSRELTTVKGSSGKAGATLEVVSDALALIKDFPDDPVPPGGQPTMTFTISNLNRSESVTGITFTDDLDATLSGLVAANTPLSDPCGTGSELSGTNLLTLTGGNLAPEQTCTFSVTLQVPGGATPGAYPNTTSSISGSSDSGPVVGSAGSETLYVQPAPQLIKEFTDDPTGPGGTATVKFTITNKSTTHTVTDLAFTDDFFSGLEGTDAVQNDVCGAGSKAQVYHTTDDSGTTYLHLSFSDGLLAAGDSCNFDVTLDVKTNVVAGVYENTTSSITGVVNGTTYTGSPATDSLVVNGAPELIKTFTDDPVLPGGTVTLEFSMTNNDLSNSTTGIEFTDDLDTTLTGLVATGLPVDDICGTGSRIDGTSTLSFTGGSLAAGDSCNFSVTLQVPGTAESGTYTNTTSDVTATSGGISVSGRPASDNLIVGELTVTKEFTDDPVIAGGNVNLRIIITNESPDTSVSSITFTDDLESVLTGLAPVSLVSEADACGTGSTLSWNSGTKEIKLIDGNLVANSDCQIDVPLSVPLATASGTYSNTVTDVYGQFDGSPNTHFQNAQAELEVNSDLLEISKSFTDDPIAPGGTGTLEFTINNLHPTEIATAITFTDDLDTALTGLVATGLPVNDVCGAGSSIGGTDTLTLTGGNLAGGASCTFSVQFQVPGTTTGGTAATNTTSAVTGTIGGLTVTGPAATDTLTINDVAFSKSFTDTPIQGGTTELTFTIQNNNTTDTVDEISFTDDLDATLTGLVAIDTPLSNFCGPDSFFSGTSTLTLGRGTLAAGDSCTFSVTVQVPGNATNGTYPNTTSDLLSNSVKAADAATADLVVDPAPYTISGRVTDSSSGDPVQGVTIIFSHNGGTATTDVNGDYSYVVLQGTTTTVTPSKIGYATWSPPNVTYSNLNGSKTQNFVGTLETFTITGQVTDGTNALEGVKLTFSHDGGTAYTNVGGNYSYTVNYGTTTTVTPTKDGIASWSPATGSFTNITENKTQNFTGTWETFTITGQVTDGTNPVEGVKLTFSHDGGTAYTNVGGNYSYTVDYGTTTTVTPSMDGIASWSPTSGSFTNITENKTQNFTGTWETFTITGQVTDGTNALEGVKLTFSHDGGTAYTNVGGNYSYTVNYGTTTTVTPTKDGIASWSPATGSFTNITENKTQNFTGTWETFTITGQVTDGTNPVEGVKLTFSHDGGTAYTNVGGNYSYTVDYGTTTTVTPSMDGIASWSPASGSFTNITENKTQNFTGTWETFTITGQVTDGTNALEGVKLTFSHDGGTAYTNVGGNYSYTVNYGTSTTVTPTKDGIASWSPATGSFTNITENKTQNFTGTWETFTITGQVTDGTNPVEGVKLTFLHDGGSTYTNVGGNYSYTVDYGTTTTVTPSMTGIASWSPATGSFTNITENKTQNFTGTWETFTITGQVTHGTDPVEGVTLTFSHDGGSTLSNAGGTYSYTVDYGTTTTVTPTKDGFASWSPASGSFTNITENKTQNFTGTLETFTITGQVTHGSNPVEGVKLTFSHDGGSTLTNAGGTYSYTVDYGTTTTVTPSKEGFASWSPASGSFTNITENKTQNFTGTLETFTISGQVTDGTDPVEGVKLTFLHDGGSTLTDAGGNYSYTVDYGTTTTVTPTRDGIASWSPASGSFTNITENKTQNFTGTWETFTISGQVTDGTNALEGVKLTFLHDGGSTLTDTGGNYSYTVNYGTTTTVTPSKDGYTGWSPATGSFTNITENKTQNFQAGLETFTISGQVTDGTEAVEGVTLTFSHDSGTTQTDAGGNYSYTVDYGTTTTVTPTREGIASWSPASGSFTNITENKTQNFTGTWETFTITGRVTDGTNPLEGVKLTFSHDGGTALTDAGGNYSYTVDYGTTTTVTPSKDEWGSWSPSSRTFTDITGNQTQDFVGQFNTYEVSGTVTANGSALEGVAITYTQGSTTTGSDGSYLFQVDSGTTTTITPGHAEVTTWTPASRTLNNITSNQPGQDFEGVLTTYELTVNKVGEADGLVTSDPAGIDCGSDCSESYPYGTSVILSATPESGAIFDGWSGNGCNGSGTCTVQMDADKTITANFNYDGDRADLALTKETNTYSPVAGGNVTFILRITNNGPEDTTGVEVTDLLPDELIYSYDNSGGDYDPQTGVWTVGDLKSGQTADMAINALFDSADVVTNTAQVTESDVIDQDLNNNNASVTLDPQAATADLSIFKTANPDPVEVGGDLVYTITVGNNGPRKAEGVEMTDRIPMDLTGAEYKIAGESGGFAPWPGTNSLDLEDLDSGAAQTVWIRGQVSAMPDGEKLKNEAEVTADTTDSVLGNNASIIKTLVRDPVEKSDLSVVKSVDRDPVNIGDNLVVTITATNNGPDDAADVKIKDKLRNGLSYVSDDSGGTYDPGSGIWAAGNMANGGSQTLNLNVLVGKSGPMGNAANIVGSASRDDNLANNASSLIINGDNSSPDLGLWTTLIPLDQTTLDTAFIANGDRFEYTVHFENNSVQTDAGVEIQVTLPDGIIVVTAQPATGCYDLNTNKWYVDDPDACAGAGNDYPEEVRNGTQSTLTLVLEVTNAGIVTDAELKAEILGAENDPDLTNNSMSRVINPTEPFVVDLAVNAMADREKVSEIQIVVFTVQVRNNGPDTAGGVQVRNLMPAELSLVGSYQTMGTFRSDTGIWTVGNLGVFESATLELAAKAAKQAENAVFRAEVLPGAGGELNPDNNTSQVNIEVGALPRSGGSGGDGGCFIGNMLCR